ncbi:MAG: AMP-binding protein, partial [bacterium]
MRTLDLFNPMSDDCLARILGRFVKVFYSKGALSSVFSAPYSKILPLVREHGLNAKTIHEIHSYSVPDRLAVVDDHRSVTYSEFNSEINQTARFLQDRYDIGPGSKVLIMMENRAEYLSTWIALSRLNASPVHTSYGLKPDELTYQVQDSEGNLIVTSEESVSTASTVRDQINDDLSIICVDETSDFDDVTTLGNHLDNYETDYPEIRETETKPENIVYTSGTTGNPKGASRELETPDDLLSRLGFVSEALGLLDKIPMGVGARQLIVSPIYHSAGQFLSLIQMILAGTVYLRPKFKARDTLEKLSQWKINNVFLVATMIRRILDLPDEVLDENPTDELEGMMFSAAPFPQTLRERTIEQFGEKTVHELYGATELGLITHIRGDEMLEKPGSVGQPLAGQEVKVFDDEGNELPPNEVGRIGVKNEEIMEGYLGKEQGLNDLLIGDWYTLDDLGYLESVRVERYGDDDLAFIEGGAAAETVTVFARGGTEHVTDELERA